MNCLEALNISSGVTSVIGSGGKTSLLRALADELRQVEPEARIILATTTHFLPFTGIELYTGNDENALTQLLEAQRVVCTGTPVDPAQPLGKLGPSPISVEHLAQLADYVLVEADGSKRLSLKAHAEHEPVVPECSNQTILVAGASGFWKPISETAHRPELFCKLTSCIPSDKATPALTGKAIAAEISTGKIAPGIVVINQMDSVTLLQTPEIPQLKEALIQEDLNIPVFGAALSEHRIWRL